MKKTACLIAIAAMLLGASACSSASQKADATEQDATEATGQKDDKQFLADINAGADPQTAGEGSNLIELEGDKLSLLEPVAGQVLAIDFGATWCGPCQKFHPTFDKAAEAFKNVRFVYVDIDDNPAAAEKYNIEAVPTIIVIDVKGNEKRYTGLDELLPDTKFFNIIENASK